MASNIPVVVHWAFSGRCNMKCAFCYGFYRDGVLPLPRKQELLDRIIAAEVRQLTITGGEPLLDPDAFPILKAASRAGLYTCLHTNGVLLDAQARTALEGSVSRISLALDGATEAMCERMRGRPGFLKWVMEILDWARQAGIAVTVKTVATRTNFEELPLMHELLAERLAHDPRSLWYISEFLGIRGASRAVDQFALPDGAFQAFRASLTWRGLKVLCKSAHEIESFPYFFLDALGDVSTWDDSIKDQVRIGSLFDQGVPELWEAVSRVHGGSAQFA